MWATQCKLSPSFFEDANNFDSMCTGSSFSFLSTSSLQITDEMYIKITILIDEVEISFQWNQISHSQIVMVALKTKGGKRF